MYEKSYYSTGEKRIRIIFQRVDYVRVHTLERFERAKSFRLRVAFPSDFAGRRYSP